MKKIILTEEQSKTLKSLLTEAASLDKIVNALSKDAKDNGLNQSDLADLIMTDPTSVTNAHGQFVGKYWKWIYNQYKQGNIHLGDQLELEAALNTYNINKSQINRPIDSFNTLDDLVEAISDYDDSFKATRTLSKGEQELEKVYEDQYVTVYIPHTWEAARKIGGDTHWCTASSNDHYFNYYLNGYGGEYYDIIRKSDGAKFQLHVESEQFMDSDDNRVAFASVFNSGKEASGLLNFLKGRGKKIERWEPKTWFDEVQGKLDAGEDPEDIFNWCGNFKEGFACVELNKKCNYINTEGKLLSETWFDRCYDFTGGFARVELNNKWNYINTNGKLISDRWFDGCRNSCDNLFAVSMESYGKKYWYFMDLDCNVKKDKPFLIIWEPVDGIYAVTKHSGSRGCNYVNGKTKKYLSDMWFDTGYNFFNGHGIVVLNGKMNLINTEGVLLSETWFDDCKNFEEGFARVKLNGEYNYINTEGKLLSETWFDRCYDFNEGFGCVELNSEYYYIDKNGKLYVKRPKNENRHHKMIVIYEDIAKEIKKDIEMSEHRFMSNVKFFLAQLLEDPVNAKPSDILQQHGFTRIKLLKELTDLDVLERHERLSDKDKDGNWKTVTMLVKYKVKRKGLDTAILKLYSKHFEKEDKKQIYEDGGGACAGGCGGSSAAGSSDCSGGATSCNSSGSFIVPLFPMVRRTGPYTITGKKKKHKKRKNKRNEQPTK